MARVWKDVCCLLCVREWKRLNGKSYWFELGHLGHLLNCVNWASVGIFAARKKEMWNYGSVFKYKQSLLGGHRHVVSFDSFGSFENQSSCLVQGSLPNQTNPGRAPQQCVSWSCASAAPCKSCPTAEQLLELSAALWTPSADGLESCDLGGFCPWGLGLMLNLQEDDVGGITCPSVFHRRCTVPFRADSLGWQQKLLSLLVCRSLGFKMLL